MIGLIRRVPLVEQEVLTHPEHLSSLPVFSGVRATRSLVLCVCFVDRCLSFCALVRRGWILLLAGIGTIIQLINVMYLFSW
jgi:hypothetical protein